MPLIVLEGIDGSGKSTQTNMLRLALEERGVEVEYMHFPRFDAPIYGELIARFLRGELGDIEAVNPYLVALLFAGDRGDAGAQIREWLAAGKTVLLDRYVYSNIAFQGAKIADDKGRNELKEWILRTEFEEFAIPRPDVSLWLDVPFEFTLSRLAEQRSGNDRDYLNGRADIHEQSAEFQRRVRDMYLQLSASQEDMVRLDCGDDKGDILSAKDIFELIWKNVEKYL